MAGAELGGSGTMNPYWVEKARRAFLTGQPRMAELYMRRGLSETAEGRRWLAAHDMWEGLKATARTIQEVAETFLAAFGWAPPKTPELIPLPDFRFGNETQERIDRMMAQFRAEQRAALQVQIPQRPFRIGDIA